MIKFQRTPDEVSLMSRYLAHRKMIGGPMNRFEYSGAAAALCWVIGNPCASQWYNDSDVSESYEKLMQISIDLMRDTK